MQQYGVMTRALGILAVLVTLAGCYNPRYPGDAPGTEDNARQRRDAAAASGGTRP